MEDKELRELQEKMRDARVVVHASHQDPVGLTGIEKSQCDPELQKLFNEIEDLNREHAKQVGKRFAEIGRIIGAKFMNQ